MNRPEGRGFSPEATSFVLGGKLASLLPPIAAHYKRKRRCLASTADSAAARLLQLGVFGFGRDQDGDVRIGVFPQREKIFVSGERADAGGVGIGALRGFCF